MYFRIIPIFFVLIFTAAFAGDAEQFQEIQKTVLANNSKIKAMEQEVHMYRNQISSSSALEDPKLKLGVNNVPITNPGFKMDSMTSKEIGISQMIPLGGKLGLKSAIAEKKYKIAQERLRKEKAELLHMARMNIYELLYIRESIKIMEEIKSQIKLFVDSEIAANKSGTGSLSNVIKANIEYNMVDEGLISLKQKERDVTSKIDYLAGSPVSIEGMNLHDDVLKEIKAGDQAAGVLSSNPDMKILALEKEISQDDVSLKTREYVPDMEFGFSYMQREKTPMSKGDDMFSAMVIFNIPVWSLSKNRPMVEEMKNKLAMSQNLLSDRKNSLVYSVDSITSRLNKWSSLYVLYKDQIIPQAELSVETSHSQHMAGTREFMSVIDGIRMLLKYKIDMSMVKKEYYADMSELHMLTGGEILK